MGTKSADTISNSGHTPSLLAPLLALPLRLQTLIPKRDIVLVPAVRSIRIRRIPRRALLPLRLLLATTSLWLTVRRLGWRVILLVALVVAVIEAVVVGTVTLTCLSGTVFLALIDVRVSILRSVLGEWKKGKGRTSGWLQGGEEEEIGQGGTTHDCMDFIHDGAFCSFNRTSRTDEADFPFDVAAVGLGDVDFATGRLLHVFYCFTACSGTVSKVRCVQERRRGAYLFR